MVHDGVVRHDFDDGYVAECNCGWKGPRRESFKEAENDLIQHYEATE